MDFIHVAFLVAAGQGLFLGLVWTLRFSSLESKFLGLFLVLYSLNLIENVGLWSGLLHRFPHLINLTQSFIFLYGPLFYLYIRSKTSEYSFKLNTIIHLIPFLLHFSYTFEFYVLSAEFKSETLSQFTYESSSSDWPFQFAIALHLLVYALCSVRLAVKTSVTQDALLSWLFLTYALSVLSYFVLINTIQFTVLHDYLISGVIVLLMYTIGYLSLLSPHWVDSRWVKKKTKLKYSKSVLEVGESLLYIQRIDALLQNQKIYLNTDLKLEDLANELGVSQNHVSQVINEQKKCSFRDLINYYRVEEVKRKLSSTENKKYTFLAIAFSCGFNNKASFNKYFKKYTGQTPKAYYQGLEVGKPL